MQRRDLKLALHAILLNSYFLANMIWVWIKSLFEHYRNSDDFFWHDNLNFMFFAQAIAMKKIIKELKLIPFIMKWLNIHSPWNETDDRIIDTG